MVKNEKDKKNKIIKDLGFLVLGLIALYILYKVFFNVKETRKTNKEFHNHYFPKSSSKSIFKSKSKS